MIFTYCPGKLESYHLESADNKYNYLIDECCPEEDPKEETLIKKKFLEDLAQKIKNFKSENPAVELKMR
uniref:Uncharacterized protein n=1 Tax=Romanomermis culicivorax TaxID=13658 RepID=A0A915KK70_ROMCU